MISGVNVTSIWESIQKSVDISNKEGVTIGVVSLISYILRSFNENAPPLFQYFVRFLTFIFQNLSICKNIR